MKTFSDVLSQLNDFIGNNSQAASQRELKRAITEAYREIADSHQWTYLTTFGRIYTVAPYSTGTITYVDTTRTITLSGGTFPTWVTKGDNLLINDVIYPIESRTNGTTLILDSEKNPSGDIATATEYELFRDSFDLPTDFRSGDTPIFEQGLWHLDYCVPEAWLFRQRTNQGTGQPTTYTIVGSPRSRGSLALRMAPAPSTAETVDYIYNRRPRAFTVGEYVAGTASATASSATITGQGTSFGSGMVGAVLRLSANSTDAPSDFEGDNPAALEQFISGVTDATTLTIESVATANYSAVKLVVTDPIDLEEGAMMNAFLRACEKQLAIGRNLANKGDTVSLAEAALMRAKDADSRSIAGQVAGGGSRAYGRPGYLADDT